MPWNARTLPIAAMRGAHVRCSALAAATVVGGGAAAAMKPLMMPGLIL